MHCHEEVVPAGLQLFTSGVANRNVIPGQKERVNKHSKRWTRQHELFYRGFIWAHPSNGTINCTRQAGGQAAIVFRLPERLAERCRWFSSVLREDLLNCWSQISE